MASTCHPGILIHGSEPYTPLDRSAVSSRLIMEPTQQCHGRAAVCSDWSFHVKPIPALGRTTRAHDHQFRHLNRFTRQTLNTRRGTQGETPRYRLPLPSTKSGWIYVIRPRPRRKFVPPNMRW